MNLIDGFLASCIWLAYGLYFLVFGPFIFMHSAYCQQRDNKRYLARITKDMSRLHLAVVLHKLDVKPRDGQEQQEE